MTTVFEAFPEAREPGWRFFSISRGEETGDVASALTTGTGNFAPIVTGGDEFTPHPAAVGTPASLEPASDAILYVCPYETPTNDVYGLMTGYVVRDASKQHWYDIVNVGLGKNAQTGDLEHLELALKLTKTPETLEDDDET